MKKFLVFCVLALVLAGSAGAQEGSTAAPADTASSGNVAVPTDQSVTPGQDSSGPSQVGSVGDEVSRLQREMEERIRAIRTEYQAKIAEARKKAQTLKRQSVKQNVQQKKTNIKSRQQQRQQSSGSGQNQGFGQQFQNSVRQNIQQGVEQNIRQNVRENVRQNIESLIGGSGSGFQQQGSSGTLGAPQQNFGGTGGFQQFNPIGPTQEQFGPSTGSGQVPPLPTSSGGGEFQSGGGSFPPPPTGGTGGGSIQPAPFSSSILQRFLPVVGW